MRVHVVLALLIAVIASGCHNRSSGPTADDGSSLSDNDNALANNAIENVEQPITDADQ